MSDTKTSTQEYLRKDYIAYPYEIQLQNPGEFADNIDTTPRKCRSKQEAEGIACALADDPHTYTVCKRETDAARPIWLVDGTVVHQNPDSFLYSTD